MSIPPALMLCHHVIYSCELSQLLQVQHVRNFLVGRRFHVSDLEKSKKRKKDKKSKKGKKGTREVMK